MAGALARGDRAGGRSRGRTATIISRTLAVALTAMYDAWASKTTNTEPGAECAKAEIELPLPTFTATAEMAGISRVMGGYHIQADNIEGLTLGRKVAEFSWPRIRSYWEGGGKK